MLELAGILPEKVRSEESDCSEKTKMEEIRNSRRIRILDLGAGAGGTLVLLNQLGFDAEGIDLKPHSNLVKRGNLLCTEYADESFDAVISQCSFYVSGDVAGAFQESFRLLCHGGTLLFSDICFEDVGEIAEQAGFQIVYKEDFTPLWKEYYLEAIWNGTAQYCKVNGKCRYYIYICRKE